MEYHNIIYDVKNQVAWITLNRPEAMNAINQEMSGEIVSACRCGRENRSRPGDASPKLREMILAKRV